MALTARTRRILLGSALAATLAAVAWVHEQTPDEPMDAPLVPAARKTAERSTAASDSRLALEKLHRDASAGDTAQIKDIFQAKSWYVPPPPPKPGPPPPPAPPPLPFSYMGKLLEDGKLTVFLTQQDRNYAVKAGDTLDGNYRVDAVDAQRVVFTYLPLNMQQTLAIGGVN